MKVLVVGSGGREHAIVWKLHRDGHQVTAWPGNPGIAEIAECHPGFVDDIAGIVAYGQKYKPELVVIGPEAPLVLGIADKLRSKGIAVFGPGLDGSSLEGSKSFSKQFFRDAGIRTADFEVCGNEKDVEKALSRLGDRVVVKADGLAAGKGVMVCSSKAEAKAAAISILAGKFGDAGKQVVVEARIEGKELSVMAITDGTTYSVLAQAEDHKTLFEGDKGPNTGGMGTVSPAPWATDDLLARIDEEIFEPTLKELARRSIDYRGVLYAGVMVDKAGNPWLLEYNCRFGDPETQPVLMRLESDLGQVLLSAANGNLVGKELEWKAETSVCVVMASPGYPEKPVKGQVISGLADAGSMGVQVFHAGTKKTANEFTTAGGRVLGVTALAEDLERAREKAYSAVEKIHFEGSQIRRDIGVRER